MSLLLTFPNPNKVTNIRHRDAVLIYYIIPANTDNFLNGMLAVKESKCNSKGENSVSWVRKTYGLYAEILF